MNTGKYFSSFGFNWKNAWSSSSFRNQFAITFMLFIAVGVYHLYCLKLWQLRTGTPVNDVILNLLTPRDFSVPIFIMEYSYALLVVIFTAGLPNRLLKGIQMFILITLARTVSIFLVPLEPPKEMIELQDPFAALLLHTPDVFVTKDLFFSGHIAALTLLMLVAKPKWIKNYGVICIIAVGFMIMCQHVHYSMDVFFAPLISFVIYRLVLWVHSETRYGVNVSEV